MALWLGLIASLVHLSASTFLIFLGTAGVLQDADQWSQHSERVVAQISLLTLGSAAGIFASALALWRRSDLGLVKLRISTGAFLTAAVMTIVSVLMGWDYWLEFGSNVAFFVVLISSAIYSLVYIFLGMLLAVSFRSTSH